MRLALVASMFDEEDSMIWNVLCSGHHSIQMEIVQSQLTPYPDLAATISAHPCAHYHLFENLDKRPAGEVGSKGERFDIGSRSMARNFSAGCAALKHSMLWGQKLDYIVGITGDTLLLHFGGVREIIAGIEEHGIDIGVSRAMGQNFHWAGWTREQMADPHHPKEGRRQDETNGDFMPQFWIARAWLIDRLSQIIVTNPWCFEQCISDAVGNAKRGVFSTTAYGYRNGILYHHPSPAGWKHGADKL